MHTPTDTEADLAALPIWQGRPVFEPLPGGLSNVSFIATDNAGKYVVRLTRDFPFHQVYREREVAIARAAHAAGFAPEVVHAAPGLMVSRFVEARPLTAADIARNIPRLVELLRRFHAGIGTEPAFDFGVFEINRDYFRQLREHAAEADLRHWTAINDRLEAMQTPLPKVFGHHDLLPGNWLDDGRRLWLIDFEYAGAGDPLFDLANLSSHARLSADQSRELLGAYFGREPDADLLRGHRAMEAASLLREALWSLVSEQHIHEREIDYRAYAELFFGRLREAMRGV